MLVEVKNNVGGRVKIKGVLNPDNQALPNLGFQEAESRSLLDVPRRPLVPGTLRTPRISAPLGLEAVPPWTAPPEGQCLGPQSSEAQLFAPAQGCPALLTCSPGLFCAGPALLHTKQGWRRLCEPEGPGEGVAAAPEIGAAA